MNRDARVEWDFEDRRVKVVKGDGTVVENTYDVDGVLVRTVINGVGTDLLVDTSGGLSHVVAEVDSAGAVAALYVRAGDMLLEEVRGGEAKMYEADGLGSVRGLLDATGATTDSWSYTAFGETLSQSGTDANPYQFAGERLVDSVGMYQNRARWLDTRTGRFVSVDPAEGTDYEPLTMQPYLYVHADPADLVDPSGKFAEMAGLMVSLSIYSNLGATAVAAPVPGQKGGAGADPNINVPLPRQGVGFKSYKTQDTQYGFQQTIDFIMDLGLEWAGRCPDGPRLLIGDLSVLGGGPTPKFWGHPEYGYHASHGSGLDFDVQVIRKDGVERPRSVQVTDKEPSQYDRPRTLELVKMIHAQGGENLKLVLTADTALRTPDTQKVVEDKTHTFHLHIRLIRQR